MRTDARRGHRHRRVRGLGERSRRAERIAASGAFAFEPNHHYDCVGPMTGMTTRAQMLMVVENRTFGNRAYCAINEGLGKVMRFGGNDAEVLDRLRWLTTTLGPAMGTALREMGGIALKPLIARGLVHGRRDAPAQRRLLRRCCCGSLRRRSRAPRRTPRTRQGARLHRRQRPVLPQRRHGHGQGDDRSCARHQRLAVVTAMCRNGTDFGIRVSGTGDQWFTAPVEMPKGSISRALAKPTPTRTWATAPSSRR